MLEWVISAKDWSWENLNASDKMPMEFYGSSTVSWFRMTLSFVAGSWMRPNKMYQDLKKNFWWTRMKQEIAKYVSECDTC
jgi:hypothetical protein